MDCLSTSEPGQPNIYVQRFPGPGGKYQVSRDGGSHPIWRADGKELFYLGPDTTLMAVPVEATDRLDIGGRTPSFRPSGPMPSFPTFVPSLNTGRIYAVTRDGQRFLAIARPRQAEMEPDRRRQLDGGDPEIAMALTPGSRLGPYEILAPLGAGGMGGSYRRRIDRRPRASRPRDRIYIVRGGVGRFSRNGVSRSSRLRRE